MRSRSVDPPRDGSVPPSINASSDSPNCSRTSSAVIADGKPLDLGSSAELGERRPALSIHVGVAGVKELVLETAFGSRGDVQAHVNWVNARLVK